MRGWRLVEVLYPGRWNRAAKKVSGMIETDNPITVPPFWLRAAGVLALGAAAVVFFGDPKAVNGAYLLVMALVSIASVLGSRIGWSLLLSIAITVVVEFMFSAQSGATAAVWGGIAIALLIPSSVRFVWRRQRRPLISALPTADRYWLASRAALYSAIAWLAQWEAGQFEKGTVLRRSFSVLLWRLGYCGAALFFVYVVAFNVQSSDGDGAGIVDVVVAISRAGFVICFLLFLGTAFAAAYARLRGTTHSPKSRSQP
jgi:hypothetical protein